MVDLAHVSLSGLGVTFTGLYQKLYSKLGKPILLCNVCIGETEYQDCYVQPVYTAEGFEMTVGDYTITVSSNSVVTATEGIVGGGEGGASELSELEDVDISTPQEGDVLTYSNGEWVNGQPSGGGSGDVTATMAYLDVAQNYQGGLPATTGQVVTITGQYLDYVSFGDNVDIADLVGKQLIATQGRVGVPVSGNASNLELMSACYMSVDYDEYEDTYYVFIRGLYSDDADGYGTFTKLYSISWGLYFNSNKELDKTNSTVKIVRLA